MILMQIDVGLGDDVTPAPHGWEVRQKHQAPVYEVTYFSPWKIH